ncbi:FaeA/PapI family transcriptional regulator [Escherichia marmotae]|uniref:FaeA/PapI family transcriptional regulator n=1 Tax=Escherichia marmotae TaxID=1499973 RepID=UPI0028154F48|nr:FaeA/PapI family transcriptional regulator [Escherichia marmotae]
MSQRSKGVFLLYLHYFVVLFLLCFVLWRVLLIGWLTDLQEDDVNNKDIDEQIVNFLENQKKHFSKKFFSTREIADAVGLTIYQARECLEVLQSSGVVEKANSGRGRPGVWVLF